MSEEPYIQKAEKEVQYLVGARRRNPVFFWFAIVVLVALAALWAYEKIASIPRKATIADQEKAIASLMRTNDALIRENQTLSIQLAPLLTFAMRTYTNEPPEKRLEVLTRRIETLEKTLADATPRLVSSNAQWLATSNLMATGVDLKWWIQPEFADYESAKIVNQISEILLAVGSGHVSPPNTLAVNPVKGIRLEYAPALAQSIGKISNAFYGLCRDLNRELTIAVHNDLGETNGLAVTVGTR
jgi:hypothetical protein